MQTLLGPAKLEGLLRSPSEALAQDLEPASPFANINAVSTFWKGILTCRGSTAKRRALTQKVTRKDTHCADFELDSFRQNMDEQGLTVAANQESSLKSRRRLAETTRGMSFAHCTLCNRVSCVWLKPVICLQTSRRLPRRS